MAKHSNKPDVYQRVTDQIISALESAGSWQKPWETICATGLPVNITGREYRGINIMALIASAYDRGYSSNTWATFKQWSDLGAKVNKGQRSTVIVFWKSFETEGDDGEIQKRMFARAFHVFNADQVSGYEIEQPTVEPLATRLAHADAFVKATRAIVNHGGNRAYYSLNTDQIQMPLLEQFRDTATSTATEGYYSTLLHELTHWTGHKSRCDRDFASRFGKEQYAAEELVAELGAGFLMAGLGITPQPRDDHAAYVASWLKVLKADKRAIFTASSKAQAACDYLYGLQPNSMPVAA